MLIFIILIVIIFDISEKIDDFVEKEAPLKEIALNYYGNFIPYFINMFSPLFVFITVIFFTSQLAAKSEIVAILAGGVSFNRLLYPYFIVALFIAIFSFVLNMYIIPDANIGRHKFEEAYMKGGKFYNNRRNTHYQIGENEFAFVESFSTWNNTAYKFTLETIIDNELVSKLSAESAVWNEDIGGWTLRNYHIRDIKDGVETIRYGIKMDTVTLITDQDFHRSSKTIQALDKKELENLIRLQKSRGDRMVKYALIEQHTRTSMPFSAFILTLMGVSLSSKRRRGGLGLNLGIGVALSFSYILFMRFSQMFVMTDTLAPALAIWLPNIIFSVIAIFLYRIAPK